MLKTVGISRFVFASSAAVYGEPEGEYCTETEEVKPVNPYGWSKRMTEIMLKDFARAYNLASVSLRFFNVAGADSDCELGQEKDGTHIIAKLMEMTMDGKDFTLNGDDFKTPDGTCIRDYVHVEDVASGIVKAVEFTKSNIGAHVFNLGDGKGYSNKEIVKAVEDNTPLKPNVKFGPARAGDPAKLVANDFITSGVLGWKPKYDLNHIVKTAYDWYQKKEVRHSADILVFNSEKNNGKK
jgi:UDP-glucose 4-epimerase